MTRRLPDWPERLHAAIEAAAARPFSWGEHDCVMFAADCVLAITSEDVAADFRGLYHSAWDASGVLERMGCADVAACADRVLGPRVEVRLARRGDVMLAPAEDGRSLGICLGAVAAFVDDKGMSFRPSLSCAAAWAVGD